MQAQIFFLLQKMCMHVWCSETILITNSYSFRSSKGNICVLCTPNINRKHSVSMETTLLIVCTALPAISQNADGKHQVNILAPLESEEHKSAWKLEYVHPS